MFAAMHGHEKSRVQRVRLLHLVRASTPVRHCGRMDSVLGIKGFGACYGALVSVNAGQQHRRGLPFDHLGSGNQLSKHAFLHCHAHGHLLATA